MGLAMNGWGIGGQYTEFSHQHRQVRPRPQLRGGSDGVGRSGAALRPGLSGTVKRIYEFFNTRQEPSGAPGIDSANVGTSAERYRTGFSIMVANTLHAQNASRGFTSPVAASEARRQLRMSVGVVVMLSVGIVSAAVTVGPNPIAAKRDVVSMKPVTTLHADTDVVGAAKAI